MTTPIGLELVWADAGGTADPGDAKYQLGWVAEIPTFQNFNHVLKALDSAKLAYAESDVYPWNDSIAYVAGARVKQANKVYLCIATHNSDPVISPDPQDPALDTTNSYWVSGAVFSSLADAFTSLTAEDGVLIDEVKARTTRNLWESNDLTLKNKNALISLIDKVGAENLILGNVQGKLTVIEVGALTHPDGVTDLRPSANDKSHLVYHEGNPPKQEEVEGTIPEAPTDGKIYARQSNNWLQIDNSNVSRDYGLITGAVDDNNDYGGLS